MTEEISGGLLLKGGRVVLPGGVEEGASVLVERGRVARVGSSGAEADAAVLDLDGLTVYPGFIDVHIHGSVGVDTLDATADDLHRVARFLAAEGVTGWLPTLVPAPEDDYRRAVSAIKQLMSEQDGRTPAALALGVHYEGPFVNERQCGALRTEYFRRYTSPRELEGLATIALEGAAHMMTLAPEVEGGVALVEELTRRGWVVSVGHTRAAVELLEQARAAGARHMTHFLNAMPQLHHREPGPVGFGLTRDDVTVDLIADGVHCDPLMLSLVVRCKTPGGVSLISDAVAPAGLGDGDYRLWGETIRVERGRTRNERGSIAGSVATLAGAARMFASLGHPEHDIARMASLNPARLLGLARDRGSIEEGKRADLTALDARGRVRLTLVAGRVAHDDRE
jgi:N-acetylglucosamine-6-phosphate deacetylase